MPETLSLPSTPESVSRAVEAAEAGARVAGLSGEVIGRVGLAVAEAVANAIEHGNAGDTRARVWIDLHALPGHMRIRVGDQGEGVAPTSLETAALPVDPLQTHGRGLYLIRVLADRCEVTDGVLILTFEERTT